MAILDVDGRAVEYTRAGTGPDLLMLHSLLTDNTVFECVVPSLQRAHRVTCVNLPGFGASAPAVLTTVADHADYVARIMRKLDLAPASIVFGNGFGAFVALEVAIRHGSSFDRLCVADVVATFPEPARVPFRTMAARVRSDGMSAVLDIAIGRMFPPAFQKRFPEVVALRKQRLAMADPDCFARACLALAELDLRSDIVRIANPTLVLCGALDQTTPPALAREVANSIPRATFAEIADSGHCPMLEQPEALVSAMLAFTGAKSAS